MNNRKINVKEVQKKALSDITELETMIQKSSKNFNEIYNCLKGYNLQSEMFDFNFKSVSGTVIKHKNGDTVLFNHFDVWTNQQSTPLFNTTKEQLIREVQT